MQAQNNGVGVLGSDIPQSNWNPAQSKMMAHAQAQAQCGAAGLQGARDKSQIERSIEDLESAITEATHTYHDLSSRLSSVKNEQPSNDANTVEKTARPPSCNLDIILMELTERVKRLTADIRSTRDGLCI